MFILEDNTIKAMMFPKEKKCTLWVKVQYPLSVIIEFVFLNVVHIWIYLSQGALETESSEMKPLIKLQWDPREFW